MPDKTRWPLLHVRRSDRTPEVVVKVVSPGSDTLQAIQQHFEDLQDGRYRALETDFFNTPVVGRKAARSLVEDWDLDLDELYWRQPYLGRPGRTPRKLVHKLIFSMPAGTASDKLLLAVRHFAQEQFEPEHRYVLALHTDEPHPHVHVVISAMKKQALERLNIRKPLLRKWRKAFARHLRAEGIAAKATQRKARKPRRIPRLKGMSRPAGRRFTPLHP